MGVKEASRSPTRGEKSIAGGIALEVNEKSMMECAEKRVVQGCGGEG